MGPRFGVPFAPMEPIVRAISVFNLSTKRFGSAGGPRIQTGSRWSERERKGGEGTWGVCVHIFRSSCLFSAFGLLPHECHLWHAPFFRGPTILATQITRQISHGCCTSRMRAQESERKREGKKEAVSWRAWEQCQNLLSKITLCCF